MVTRYSHLEGMLIFTIAYVFNWVQAESLITILIIIVRRILHKHRAVWYKIGLHLPGVQRSDLDAIWVDSEDSSNQQSNCEACSKKLAELAMAEAGRPNVL